IQDHTLVIGAPTCRKTPDLDASGVTFVYRGDGTGSNWIREARLTASDAGAHDEMGNAVAIDGTRIVVGAHQHEGAGATYLFQQDLNCAPDPPAQHCWSEAEEILPSDLSTNRHFGNGIAFQGNTLVAAAPDDGTAGVFAGSTYVFDTVGAACGETCPGCFGV